MGEGIRWMEGRGKERKMEGKAARGLKPSFLPSKLTSAATG